MNPEIIPEDQVSVQRLSELLTRAFFTHEIDEDGDLLVTVDRARMFVMLDEERKFIKFLLSYSITGGTEAQRNAYANRLNRNYIFASFFTTEDSVAGEYYLPYEGGVLAYQIIYALRRLHSVVTDVTILADEDNLLGRDPSEPAGLNA